MISGMANSYIGYISSKKTYLKRKKKLNRQIKIIKKRQRLFNSFGRKYFKTIIEKGNDDLYVLSLMYKYYKRKNKFKSNS